MPSLPNICSYNCSNDVPANVTATVTSTETSTANVTANVTSTETSTATVTANVTSTETSTATVTANVTSTETSTVNQNIEMKNIDAVSVSADSMFCDTISIMGEPIEDTFQAIYDDITTLETKTQNLTANASTSTFANNIIQLTGTTTLKETTVDDLTAKETSVDDLTAKNTNVDDLTAKVTLVDSLTSKLGVQSQSGSNGATQNNYFSLEWLSNSFSVFVDSTRIFRAPFRIQSVDISGLANYDFSVPFASELRKIEIDWYNTGIGISGTSTDYVSIRVASGGSHFTTGYNSVLHSFGSAIQRWTSDDAFQVTVGSVDSSGDYFGKSTITYITQNVIELQSHMMDRTPGGQLQFLSSGYQNGNGVLIQFIRLGAGLNGRLFTSGSTVVLTYIYK